MDTETSSTPKDRTSMRLVLFGSILWAGVGVFGFLPFLSAMWIFENPGAEQNLAVQLFVYSLATFPIVCIAASVFSWILYACSMTRFSLWTLLVPLLNLVLVAFAYGWLFFTQGGIDVN